MGVKVAKFGGTSVADADQIRKVEAIVRADNSRRYIVPSAPGKRSATDSKITDLLYLCHQHAQQEVPFEEVFSIIACRYTEIVRELGLSLDLAPHLETIKREISNGTTADYTASRGEYLSGLILAALLSYEFIDPTRIIFFDSDERLDLKKTKEAVEALLSRHERAVIPGFYGAMPDTTVKTFSRGGSDITGALIASGIGAEVYENWTDVSGLLMADPAIVDDPKPIDTITYRELRELAYMGAKVLHDEAIFPVKYSGIPVLIKNTNSPEDRGTLITQDAGPITHEKTITGIAGKKDFTIIMIEKSLMNTEIGFGRRLLTVLEAHNVSFEHMPSGIDTISLVIEDKQLVHKMGRVIEEIRAECKPDSVEVYPNMALIATVGRGMIHTPGIAARIFTALYKGGVNVRMIDQGSSEINIIVGVETKDFEQAIRSIYNSFVE
jgi:aspartate kinase